MEQRDGPRSERLAAAIVARLNALLPATAGLRVELERKGVQPNQQEPAAWIVIRSPEALARLLWPPTPEAFAEGYLRGDLEIEGDMVAALGAARSIRWTQPDVAELRRLIRWGLELRRRSYKPPAPVRSARLSGRRHSRARDLEAVRFHYDVGNEFYRLWLDEQMVYSCAYFERGDDPAAELDEAQRAKLDLICRKLRLASGIRLLDIGCGWGGLILHAAERYGIEAVGVTLSERQASVARAAASRRGLGDRVRVDVRDYRDLAPLGSFHAVASVGMFEHVGRERLGEYFRAALGAVRPGGLFLNHGIATGKPPGTLGTRRGSFVDRFVFPDGDLVGIEEALARAREAGFEVIDVESLRPHYALTLRAWTTRLEANAAAAVAAAGPEVYRTWRLYMSAARRLFEVGEADVFQALLARPLGPGEPAPRPLRSWWSAAPVG